MSVFYDGEFLCVQLNRNIDYKVVLDIAKDSPYSQYMPSVGIYCLPPTKQNARRLHEAGYPFDATAAPFIQACENKRESVSSPIPNELYPFQKEGVEKLLSNNRNYLLADEMGCLDGESIITVNRRKGSRKMSIAKFYERFHRLGNYSRYKIEYEDEPYYVRSFNEGYFRLGEVYDVIDSGVKECVRITTEKGKQLILTPDHKVYTENGMVEAKDSLGEYVICNETNRFINPTYEKVIRVESVGERHTYDIKVINHNNFVANHILVHNCGKTVQVLTYLKLNPKSLPAVVVCPASLKLNWAKEVEKWVGVKPYPIYGRTPQRLSEEFVEKYPVWIINYDILGVEDAEEKRIETERRKACEETGAPYKKRKLRVHGWCDEISRHGFKTIICDEVQNIAEEETLRSRGVSQICEGDSRKIFLSGTPYETRTSQFFTCLHILDRRLFPNRWRFLMTYCNPKKTFFGWQFQGLSNGEQLHQMISPLMIRRLKKDVLSQLPPKNRIVVPMDVSAKERRVYDQCDMELQQAVDNHETNALTKLAKLKQASFEAKRTAIIQWIKDYLEVNDKLVVFVYHKAAFHTLMDEFSRIAVGINGETAVADRQKAVDSFQLNSKTKLFVGQIKSCNAGLTLTAANATCFVEFGTTCVMHEQAEDRVHRISQTADSVFAYYLILDDSIDNVIMDVLNSRNADMKKVLNNESDGELFKKEDDFNDIILSKYAERRRKTLQ